MNNREKLMKLLKEHPNTELKFMVYNDGDTEEGYYNLIGENHFSVDLKELATWNDVTGDYEDIYELVQNQLSDDPQYSDASYEEFTSICERFIEDFIEFEEYIVVWL